MRADKPSSLKFSLLASMLALVSALTSHAIAATTQVAAPVIAASDGSTTCKPAQTVAISDATAGAQIYYTTDGTPPVTSSNLYTGPVTLTGTQTLLARAFASGDWKSETATATAGKLLPCDDEITMTVGGYVRTFVIHVPASYATKHTQANPSPLLIDIHGYQAGESSETVVAFEVQNSGELEMSNARGFIAIWPESTTLTSSGQLSGGSLYHSWAGVYCCKPALGLIDDVGFLKQVITWGEANGLIDTSRIYITGHSNGAQMTHRMGCEASDVVTAIAPISWPINETADQCASTITHPMPVMEVHGTKDETILYDGETTPPANYTDPPLTTSSPAGAEVWRQINQCDPTTPVPTYVTANGITYNGPPKSIYPDMITQIKGTHCAKGVYTGLITIENAPHVVFDYALTTDNFNVAQYLWNTVFTK